MDKGLATAAIWLAVPAIAYGLRGTKTDADGCASAVVLVAAVIAATVATAFIWMKG